jgi:arylsulfatase A-like enzyme
MHGHILKKLAWAAQRLRAMIVLGLLVPLSVLLHAADSKRFNLISVVTDDQAHWSVGAYGNRESRTPNMDQLARDGARFLNAFVTTPVCSPSRATFLTGRYGTQLGITDWITPAEAKAGLGLPPESVTWPEVLQKHGYVTGLIGKWHLGEKAQFHPTRHGFNHFFGFLAGGTTPMDPTFEVEGVTNKLKGPEPDLVMDNAIQFIERNRARPFALLIHFRAPHLPYGPVPEEDAAPFKELDPTIPNFPGLNASQVKRWTKEYYASIHSVDRNLGRLLVRLDELKLASRTIVLFTSDHGYNIGHHGIHTKGNGVWVAGGASGPKRPNMFEESLRVPLLIRWPGVVNPGVEITNAVSNLDTFAAVLGMLRVPKPRGWKQEGIDFSPLLRGEAMLSRAAIFGQYDLHNGGLAYLRMIRTEEWKLVRHYFTSGLDELYDLKDDPGETRNVYDRIDLEAVRNQLQKRLAAWQKSIHDPILGRLETKQIVP